MIDVEQTIYDKLINATDEERCRFFAAQLTSQNKFIDILIKHLATPDIHRDIKYYIAHRNNKSHNAKNIVN